MLDTMRDFLQASTDYRGMENSDDIGLDDSVLMQMCTAGGL